MRGNLCGQAGWKPVPSTARVTRDGVSGLPIMKGELSGRQYLPPSEASVESDKSVFELKPLRSCVCFFSRTRIWRIKRMFVAFRQISLICLFVASVLFVFL